MCNLYASLLPPEAMTGLAGDFRRHDSVGNSPPLPGIFPDDPAPIIRNSPRGRELAIVRWGMPTPEKYLVGKKVDRGVTNVRHTNIPHWRPWLGIENRCVVPFTSFAEFDNTIDEATGNKKGDTWFAFDKSRPLAFFAGVWTPEWHSTRKLKEGPVSLDLFAFLTTTPNNVVGSIHMKAMPVILTTKEEIEAWLTADWSVAKKLQRPLPDGVLEIVAVGKKSDMPEAA